MFDSKIHYTLQPRICQSNSRQIYLRSITNHMDVDAQ